MNGNALILHMADEAATMRFGGALAGFMMAGDIILLEGTLGAGKSTLARGIIAGLGFAGEVASPTFAICHPYAPPDVRLAVNHCDFYRLHDPQEADELGLDDALYDGALIAEWPGNGPAWTRRNALIIHIEDAGEGQRALTLTAGQAWKDRWQKISTL